MHTDEEDYSDVLQLGVGLQKQPLVLSPSFVQQKQPTLALQSTASGSTTPPWVTQLALLKTSNSLLSYTDGDELLRIHDKWTLQATQMLRWPDGGSCTSIKPAGQGFVAAGRNGLLGCWDGRQEGPTLSLKGPSRAPYLAVAASENMLAGGTELHGADATIDIWDIRQAKAPVLTYAEAHSDDITTLDFHSTTPTVLLSASSDGLIAISDVRQADEDDSVVGVVNTGASVARAGWGGSGRTFAKQQADDDDDEGARRLAQLPALGAFYSVSDMQTFGIWEADGFSEVMPVRDVRHTHMSITSLLPPWQTEYVIDASADPSLLQSNDGEGVTLFCGVQTGAMALMEIVPPQYDHDSTSSLPDWALHCTTAGGHDDVVRSVAWDASSYALYSGGEDGRICVWSLSDQQHVQSGLPLKEASFVGSQLDNKTAASFDAPKAAGPDRQPLKGSVRGSGIGSRSAKDGTSRTTSYNPY